MTILHIATTLEGGAGIGLWRYHQALQAAGLVSRILVLQPPAQPSPEISTFTWRRRSLPRKLLIRLGLKTRSEAFRLHVAHLDRLAPSPPDYELFTSPFSEYCPESHPWIQDADVVNLHWLAGGLDWSRFFGTLRKPVVITLHDQHAYLGGFHYSLDERSNPHLADTDARLRKYKRRAIARNYPAQRLAVVGNSEWNTSAARESGTFPANTKYSTVYYPLDADVFTPRPREPAISAAGLDPGRHVIGFACENLDNHRKGFDLLLGALDLLPSSWSDRVSLLSFGRDPAPDRRSKVRFPWHHLGFLKADDAKVAAYAAMDVFVAPSRAEAFGLTALEAQAVGVPVVATAVGGLVEAVPWARALDAKSICAEIINLLQNGTVRRERSESGRRLAVERHNPVHIGAQLRAVYTALVP